MKTIRSNELSFIPAGHEDPERPGVLKKVLLSREDLSEGRVQMINYARLPAKCSFNPHYHEDMEEVFVIVCGSVLLNTRSGRTTLGSGDAVVIEEKEIHSMTNLLETDAEYVVVGISRGRGGKTIVTENVRGN